MSVKDIRQVYDAGPLPKTFSIFISFSSLIIISLLVSTQIAFGLYFGKDINITNHKLLSPLLLPKQIAATEKGDVYVVWVEKNSTSGHSGIEFISSNDRGKTFLRNELIDNVPLSLSPQIAATEKGDVYVVWVEKNSTSGHSGIEFISSNDRGKTFLRNELIDNVPLSLSPQIAATEKGDVYVVWVEKNSTSGDSGIEFISSNDRGKTFLRNELIENVPLSLSPQIAATEKGDVYVVWVEKNSTSGDSGIEFISSNDRGKTFLRNELIENVPLSLSPQIAATEKGDVYVVWIEKNSTSGDSGIEFISSNDRGKTFLRNELIDNVPLSLSPQIAATEKGDVYVVWVEKNSTSGDSGITFTSSHDSGMEFGKRINLNISQRIYYKYSLDFSAKDVNQLHSKVLYYDSDKKEIKSDFIFGGRDGAFKDSINSILPVPPAASHIKLQMWVRQNAINDSSYVLYDASILPSILKNLTWINESIDTQTISKHVREGTSGNNSLRVDVKKGNATYWSVISTDFIPVHGIKLSTTFSPQVAATEKGDVYVVWVGSQVQFKEILDKGTVFGETISLSNRIPFSLSPQIVATEKGDVYVIWIGKNNIIGDEAILFKRISNSFLDRNT